MVRMKVFSEKVFLGDYQRRLLNETGLEWSESKDGISIDFEKLDAGQFELLVGNGCFTYHQERVTMKPDDKQELKCKFVLKHANRFIGEDEVKPNGERVLRSFLARKRFWEGSDVLGHFIVKNGVEVGFVPVWGHEA